MSHRRSLGRGVAALALLLVVILAQGRTAHSQADAVQQTLEYMGRYRTLDSADHVVTALQISPNRAIIAGTRMVLVDLNALPPGGSSNYLDLLVSPELSHRNLYQYGNVVYSNLHAPYGGGPWGFGVIRVVGDDLIHVRTITEPNVFYEKMAIAGNRLYVAAHSDGIRVFDISNAENPVLIGRIDAGFVDAFDIAVQGNVAYVADGGGGLKIVDITDPADPVLKSGENLSNSLGSSQAVTVAANGDVLVAAGSAGVNIYRQGSLTDRTLIDVGGMVEDLAWSGDNLLVTTYREVVVLELDGAGGATIVARETSHRLGSSADLRLATGIGTASDGRVLLANWKTLDVFRLKPAAQGLQADINSSVQRIRFQPSGGSEMVTLTNNGQRPLRISGARSTSPAFSVGYAGGRLSPGQSVSFPVTYNGSPTQGIGRILINSNDPDENPLPIQVFGKTPFLDPGEPAKDFTLPLQSQDPITGEWSETPFTLSDFQGKVVWMAIYGLW